MSSKGQTSQTLQDILDSTDDAKFPDLLDKFIQDANISVPEGIDTAKIVSRKKRLIESAGNVTSVIMKAVRNMNDTLIDSGDYQDYQELFKNFTLLSEEERKNITKQIDNSEDYENIQNIQELDESEINNRIFGPLLSGLTGALINPFFSALANQVVSAVAKPLIQAAASLIKILLDNFVDQIGLFTPLLRTIMQPIGGLVNTVFDDTFDSFMPEGYYKEVKSANNTRFNDTNAIDYDDTTWELGLVNQSYSWNPTNSPNMCEKAQKTFCPQSSNGFVYLDNADCKYDYWNSSSTNKTEHKPGQKCNEYIYAQM